MKVYSLRDYTLLQRVYGITLVMALYFNFFVLAAQGFDKSGALKALAPTQKEPPFAIAQGNRAGAVLRARSPGEEDIPS